MSTLVLKLNRKLYTATSLKVAVEAFQGLASIVVERTESHFVIRFEDADPDVKDVLAQEFGNYALAETIEGRGSASL